MKYRILSLDGGGIWSLIQVLALGKLYGPDKKGHDVLKKFDLVAANSGGSFVLGGLLENMTLKELFSHFQNEDIRRDIFAPNNSMFYRVVRAVTKVGPKHSTHKKFSAIQQLLSNCGKRPLKDVTTLIRRPGASKDIHILIIAFDYDRNRAAFFRSADTGDPQSKKPSQGAQPALWGGGKHSNATVAEAIHASSNAPVNYFDLPAEFPLHKKRFWDGGVTGCNNPIVAAVTEALCLHRKPTEIAALSIGTGTVALLGPKQGATSPFYQKLIQRRLSADKQIRIDILKLATAILDDPPDIANFLAHVMTGAGEGVLAPAQSRIVRLSPLVSPMQVGGEWKAPGNWSDKKFAYLANLDIDIVRNQQVDVLTDYAHLWTGDLAPNQPIRMNGDTLEVELGFGWFSEAVKAWDAIKY